MKFGTLAGMKKSAWITAATAAVVVAGGVGAYALTSQDEPTPVETAGYVFDPEAAPSVTTAPTVEASETPTPTVEPTPEPTYSDGEEFLIRVTQQDLPELALTAEQILEAAAAVCASPEAGSGVPHDAFATASADQQLQFRVNAQYHVCD